MRVRFLCLSVSMCMCAQCAFMYLCVLSLIMNAKSRCSTIMNIAHFVHVCIYSFVYLFGHDEIEFFARMEVHNLSAHFS